jgi:hypothetical protein
MYGLRTKWGTLPIIFFLFGLTGYNCIFNLHEQPVVINRLLLLSKAKKAPIKIQKIIFVYLKTVEYTKRVFIVISLSFIKPTRILYFIKE